MSNSGIRDDIREQNTHLLSRNFRFFSSIEHGLFGSKNLKKKISPVLSAGGTSRATQDVR